MSRWLLWGAALLALAAAPACKTEGFCFENCEGAPLGGAGGDGGTAGVGAGGGFPGGGGSFNIAGEGGTGGNPCVPSADGLEICNGADDDCDGQIDEAQTAEDAVGVDYTNIRTCGTCDTDCTALVVKAVVTCVLPDGAVPGQTPGTCGYSACSDDWYDVDDDPATGCEYYCQWNREGTNATDPGAPGLCGADDDCDGEVDDEMNTCTDFANCGGCGLNCDRPHATTSCATTAAAGEACNADATKGTVNTGCQIDSCDTDWHNLDGVVENGCEYPCTVTNSGAEICDGLDNDCDGRVDNADPDLEIDDVAVGTDCYGSPIGLCGTEAHKGVSKCFEGQIACCEVASNNTTQTTNTNLPETGVRNGICRSTQAPIVLFPDVKPDICDGIDNNCDNVVDGVGAKTNPIACTTDVDCAGQSPYTRCLEDLGNPGNRFCSVQPTDVGTVCGSAEGSCEIGTVLCENGVATCVGAVGATPELCDGEDNDCDGVIDGTAPTANVVSCTSDANCAAPNLACLPLGSDPNVRGCVRPPTNVADSSGFLVCDAPTPPPQGASSPCQAGVAACRGGILVCEGSVVAAPGAVDACGDDTNCNGTLENQTGLSNSDPDNCGSCGFKCSSLGVNADWTCVNGTCTRVGCEPGFIECGGTSADDCETACTFQSSNELCNNADDNCNCQVDENPSPVPTPAQVCGVSPAATEAGCTSGVTLTCTNTGWQCNFPAGYCTGSSCATTTDICDGLDNDCDGVTDKPFIAPQKTQGYKGQACFSDALEPAGSKHGPCQTQGTFICNGAGTDTICSAAKDESLADPELCNGIDDDCDGAVDDAVDVLANDSTVGNECFGGTQGICADPANAGLTACVSGVVQCTGLDLVYPGQRPELCNFQDDDCDGSVDESGAGGLTDIGIPCGNGLGECSPGTYVCITGALVCQGGQAPVNEVCDGKDNDCDGAIDDSPTDVGTACDVPPPAPLGAQTPCKAGTLVCIGGAPLCQGSIVASQATDDCFWDSNCNGTLENQTGLTNNDVSNCGACGNDCNTIDANANWSCQSGVCVRTSCKPGRIDCDGNANTCETACTFTSSTESCDGDDDNCNCQIDEVANLAVPTPVQACGVSPSATQTGCTSGVTITCTNGAWGCQFPTDYCSNGTCAATPELCDTLDNDCDGAVDETFKYPALTQGFIGQGCASDDGLSTPHGPCQTTGTFICDLDTKSATECSATKNDGAATAENCDGVDDDCDGVIDDSPTDATIGDPCFGGTTGLCADAASAGAIGCQSGALTCTGGALVEPGDVADTCNNVDDDCDGFIDGVAPPSSPTPCTLPGGAECAGLGVYSLCLESQVTPGSFFCVAPTSDVGGPCGSGVGNCQVGVLSCVNGAPVCTGGLTPQPEICNGLDDDCDGTADETGVGGLTDVGLPCDTPSATQPAPIGECAEVVFPCVGGVTACVTGTLTCQGSVTRAAGVPDSCCEDSNCDGVLALSGQADLPNDENNCGACGNDCDTANASAHGDWTCSNGTCTFVECLPGYADCDGTPTDCERPCLNTGVEVCNGVDDDCNCVIDDVDPATIPDPASVCGVSPNATDPLCDIGDGTTGIAVTCVLPGVWSCDFPPDICTGTTCSTTTELCDGKDNDCDGGTDETYKLPVKQVGALNTPCYSDDGLLTSHGECRGAGVFYCDTATSTACNAQFIDANAGDELCDGADNDCDGSIDETYEAKGTDPRYVKPAVVAVDTDNSGTADMWIYQYEASRPNATPDSPGTGNGYQCSGNCAAGVPDAPSGVTLDQTVACSTAGTIPWFNVTPIEAEQTCDAMGGFVCPTPDWTASCEAGANCSWGYAPQASCSVSAPDTCNLAAYDFNSNTVIDDDGLLPTGSLAAECYADVDGTPLYDITGNLREITKRGANDYPLLGGAFNSQSEAGAACDFTFYSVTQTFQFYDTGFRCCFSQNPSL